MIEMIWCEVYNESQPSTQRTLQHTTSRSPHASSLSSLDLIYTDLVKTLHGTETTLG